MGCLGTILVVASTYFIKQGKVKLHQTEILNSVATLTEVNITKVCTYIAKHNYMYSGIGG